MPCCQRAQTLPRLLYCAQKLHLREHRMLRSRNTIELFHERLDTRLERGGRIIALKAFVLGRQESLCADRKAPQVSLNLAVHFACPSLLSFR